MFSEVPGKDYDSLVAQIKLYLWKIRGYCSIPDYLLLLLAEKTGRELIYRQGVKKHTRNLESKSYRNPFSL